LPLAEVEILKNKMDISDSQPATPPVVQAKTLAEIEMLKDTMDISANSDLQTAALPLAQILKTHVNVVPLLDGSPQPKAGQKRRQDSSKKSQGHGSRCGRQPAGKHIKLNSSARVRGASTAVTHTNQTIRDILEKKGYQIIADHQADKLADLEEETRNTEVPIIAVDVSAEGERAILNRPLPTDEEAMLYFANIISAFNKGSLTELRDAIDHVLAPNAVFRSHSICLPGSDNPPFADRIIPGKTQYFRCLSKYS
jgi:hypothetical protein